MSDLNSSMGRGDPFGLSLEEKIGQMLLIGFPGGTAGERLLLDELERRPMGNLILFSRNADGPKELGDRLARLRSAVTARTGIAPLVALDQEGGIVTRLRRGLTPLPGAMAIASAVGGGSISIEDIEGLAEISGAELASMGIHWNLAPVVDVNVNSANPVIGVRSFGEDAASVADLASAYARGLARSGVLATAKHFPGHGDTSVDSHLSLPRVDADMERLESVELPPFRRLIAEGIPAIMTAHALFPAVEPDPIPATLSYRTLTGLLRGRLGFKGIIVTDCLEMKAVQGRYEDLAARAVLAGADMLCVSHTASIQEAAFDSIRGAVMRGRIPESRIDESVVRILAAKASLAAHDAGSPVEHILDRVGGARASQESMALSRRIADASICRIGEGRIPNLSTSGLYIDIPPTSQTEAEEGGDASPSVSEELRGFGAAARSVLLPCEPSTAAIDAMGSCIQDGPVVLGLYGVSTHPAQLALAERVAAICDARGIELAFVSMRDPYDAAVLGRFGGRAVLCAFEYTALSARAVARALMGLIPAKGVCPVHTAHP